MSWSLRASPIESSVIARVETPVNGSFLDLGGFVFDKDPPHLGNEMRQSFKSQSMVGEATCSSDVDSSLLDVPFACGTNNIGLAVLDLALFTRDEPLVCEPLSCCSPFSSI